MGPIQNKQNCFHKYSFRFCQSTSGVKLRFTDSKFFWYFSALFFPYPHWFNWASIRKASRQAICYSRGLSRGYFLKGISSRGFSQGISSRELHQGDSLKGISSMAFPQRDPQEDLIKGICSRGFEQRDFLKGISAREFPQKCLYSVPGPLYRLRTPITPVS